MDRRELHRVSAWRMFKAQKTADTGSDTSYMHLVQCPLCAPIPAVPALRHESQKPPFTRASARFVRMTRPGTLLPFLAGPLNNGFQQELTLER